MTKDELKNKVMEEAKQIGLAKAVYDIHDKLIEKEMPMACCKGCSICCQQLVGCSLPEWAEIDKFLTENKLWEKIKKRNRKYIRDWTNYRKENLAELQKNGIKALQDWFDKPCIFLNKGICDIYPVRPMNCRTISSTRKCQEHSEKECRRFRWEYERWLTEIFWESGPCMVIIDWFLSHKRK